MRILVVIIAILAFIGGLAYILGGMAGFAAGLAMLLTNIPKQVAEASAMSPKTIGLILLFSACLMLVNGLLFVVFAIGTFMRKRWARILGIFAYALNIVVCVSTMATATVEGSLFPWIFGIFVALAFMTVLAFSKSAYEKPMV
jgi:hypothetical protein